MAYKFGIATNKAKDIIVKIGGVEISKDLIIEMDISYGIDSTSIHGSLTYNDLVGTSETIQFGTEISIYMSNSNEEFFYEEFIITSAIYSREIGRKNTMVISFEDKLTIELKKRFVSVGFETCSFKEVILDPRVSADIFLQRIPDFSDTGVQLKNFVIPTNKGLLFSIEYLKRKTYSLLYRSQFKFILTDLISLLNKDPVIEYFYKTDNELLDTNMYDFSIEHSNFEDFSFYIPNLKLKYFDIKDKSVQTSDEFSYQNSANEMPFENSVQEFETSTKEIYSNDILPENHYKDLYLNKSLEAFFAHALVPCAFSIEPGNVISVNYGTLSDDLAPEANTSGKWLIKEKTIVYTQKELFQKLLLVRPKSNKQMSLFDAIGSLL